MGKAKRVRFLDDQTDDFLRSSSSNQEAEAENRIIDAPKTSEYAFFKKIKKDAGCSYFRSLPEVEKESKSAQFYNHGSGQPVGGASLSDTLESRHPGTKFSSLAEKERNAKHYSFISPLSDATTKSATKRQTGTADKIKQSNFSVLLGNVTPAGHNVYFSPTARASANEGNQYFGKGVFAEKRRKLQQQTADTLFPELGEDYSKGFHSVSKLLNRLFPKSCDNDENKLIEQKMDDADHLSTLPTSCSSLKEVHLVHKKKSMELKNESFFDDIAPTYFRGITKKNLAWEREDSPATYDTNANFVDYVADPQFIRRYQNRNSSFRFPYEKMSTNSFHIEELEEYSDLSRSRKREPHNFLLDWDFKREKEKNDLYFPARDVEDYTFSTLRTSRIGHKDQFIDDGLDEITLPSLSFPLICPKYDLMPYCQPNCFDSQNARRLLEYGNQEDLEPRQSSSRLSSTPKYLTLPEGSSIPNVLECGSPTRYCHNNPCCITNVFSDKPRHSVKALLLPGGVDIDIAWKCLSSSSTHGEHQLAAYYGSILPQRTELSTPFLTEGEFDTGLNTSNSRKTYVPSSEDAFTHQDCLVTNILDRELVCRSLIDNSCWDEPYIPMEEDYR